jgi:hypothetical protein
LTESQRRDVKKGYNPSGVIDSRNSPGKAQEGYNPKPLTDARNPSPPRPQKKDQK